MKIQVPVLGGLRKKVSISSGTSIAGYDSLTLAQLASLLGVVQAPKTLPNTISQTGVASLNVGPGLTGGGPLIGNVALGLALGTLPAGSQLYDSDAEDYGMMLSLPGPQGLRGLQGFSIPGLDGIDGEDGFPGIPGAAGATGPQGPAGPAGSGSGGPVPWTYNDFELDDPLHVQGLPGNPGGTGPTGPTGPAGLSGYPIPSEPEDPEMPQVIPGAAANVMFQQRGCTWSNPSSPLTTSSIQDVSILIPVSCVIQRCTILTKGGIGSCQVDIWSSPIGSYPPNVTNSLCGGNLPTISSGLTHDDSTLTSWATALPAGNVVTFHLDSTSTFNEIVVMLTLQMNGVSNIGGYTNNDAVGAVANALANTGDVVFTYAAGAITANYVPAGGGAAPTMPIALPGGFYMIAGTFTLPSSGATVVTFPSGGFPTGCIAVVPSQGQSASYGYPFSVASISKTGFSTDSSAGGGIVAGTGYYIAIGY
jgi:hypothetical protein